MSARPAHLPPILRQWALLLALLGLGVCGAVWGRWLWREDLLIYDAGLSYGAAPDDLVIVAIDDASLAQIGRWPWRRAVHAALLERLRAAGVRGVALDVVFTEPDRIAPQDDAALAAALANGPPTVLPLIVDWAGAAGSVRESLPLPALAAAAAGLGHAHLELDRDGIARSVFLREGAGQPNRSQLGLALLEAVHAPLPVPLPGERRPARTSPDGVWARDYRMLIPFLGPPGHFRQVSYLDVLRGRVPRSQLAGRLVLVGATAQGLSDAYPTPRSGEGVAMPGIEITANVLDALRKGHAIEPAPRGWSILISLAALLAAFVGFLRLSPRNALGLVAALCAATLGGSLLALRFGYWWWPPAPALLALILAYPLWSWRRLEAAQVYLDEELTRLDQEPAPLAPALPDRRPALRIADSLEGRIERVRDATARLRQLRTLLGETIAALPDAILLVDREGRIVLANPQAATLFAARDPRALEGEPADEHFRPLLAGREASYRLLAESAPASIEVRHPGGRDLMLRVAAFHDAHGERVGSVIDIADISDVKSAERERDDTIRFLSHDLRSPSSSLLGLAQVLRDPARSLSPADTAQRIETLASRTLALADGFIALARAHVLEPGRFEYLDLRDVLQDAIDEVWAAAEAKRVTLEVRLASGIASAYGDRGMLARALTNLIGNAVKYSSPQAPVVLEVRRRADCWCVTVRDEGPGIPVDRQRYLFQRFRRAVHHGEFDPGGVGLGLAFVRVVAQKHGGSVTVESDSGRGATFEFAIPALDPAPAIDAAPPAADASEALQQHRGEPAGGGATRGDERRRTDA